MNHNKGMTLVELMVAVAISGIIMAGLSFFLFTSLHLYAKNSTTVSIQNEAQVTMSQLSQHIMEATGIVLNYDTTVQNTDCILLGRILMEEVGGTDVCYYSGKAIISDVGTGNTGELYLAAFPNTYSNATSGIDYTTVAKTDADGYQYVQLQAADLQGAIDEIKDYVLVAEGGRFRKEGLMADRLAQFYVTEAEGSFDPATGEFTAPFALNITMTFEQSYNNGDISRTVIDRISVRNKIDEVVVNNTPHQRGLRNQEVVSVDNKRYLSAPEAYAKDNRQIFNILEIVPNEVCSIFPYLVEWGNKEAYDANVPIGYEGVLKAAGSRGSKTDIATAADAASEKSGFYTYIERGIKRETLTDYTGDILGTEDDKSARWYRVLEVNEIRTESGYFEYVGSGKGLYILNRNNNYEKETMAAEIGKGAWGLEGFAFYVLGGEAQGVVGKPIPGNPNTKVKSVTTANYDLSFAYKDKGGYDIKEVTLDPDTKGSYAADDIAFSNTNGNYAITKAQKAESGRFVREETSNPVQNDGFYTQEQIDEGKGKAGYFRRYTEATDSGKSRYNLTFQKLGSGKYNVTKFAYVGKEKGAFSVYFEYMGVNAGTYQANKLAVTDGKGQYAAASTAATADGRPVFSNLSGIDKDYNQIITKVKNCNDNGVDTGEWVWVTVTDPDLMQQTKAETIEGVSKPPIGTRVYVTNQKRQYKYYAKDSFKNNEWLKLLCLMSDPNDKNTQYPYDYNKTALENLQASKSALDDFDANHQIVIRQVQAKDVTIDIVNQADLIYIGLSEAVLSIQNEWEWLTGEKPPAKVITDVSFPVALQIYQSCVLDESKALMLDMNLHNSEAATPNLYKLFYMTNFFDDHKLFGEFLPSSGFFNSNYSTVNETTGAVTVTNSSELNSDVFNPHILFTNRPTSSQTVGQWTANHFRVWKYKLDPQDPEGKKYIVDGENSKYAFEWNLGGNDKNIPKDTHLTFDWYGTGWFRDIKNMKSIHTILHNVIKPTVIEITNAKINQAGEKVIYVDELDSEFKVEYKVITGDGSNANVTIAFADNWGTQGIQTATVSSDAINTVNVRKGFTNPYGSDDPITALDPRYRNRKVLISVPDGKGGTIKAGVTIVVRDLFELN